MDEIKALAEVFRCLICVDKLVDARMCPQCSKLFCLACIKRWLTEQKKNKCPYCSTPLRLYKLVICRWGAEVAEQIETIQQTKTGSDVDRCPTHDSEFSIYCSTCRLCICPICALFSVTHKEHIFQQLGDIYEEHINSIKNEADKLRQSLIKSQSFLRDVERHENSLRTMKEERVREARNAVDLTIACLESALESKLLALKEQENSVTKETSQLTLLIQDIEHQMKNCSKSQLIRKSNDIHQMIKTKTPAAFLTAPDPTDFQSEIVPDYATDEFTVNNFTTLRHEDKTVDSPPLNVNGICWILRVFPGGRGTEKGKYLAIGLKLVAGLPGTSKYDYKLEMLHQVARDPSKNVVRDATSAFKVGKFSCLIRFHRLDALTSGGYLDPERDTLKFRFQVRPPTYYQRCKEQQWYSEQLQEKLRIYETSKEEPSRTIEQLLTTQNQLQEKLRIYETSKGEPSRNIEQLLTTQNQLQEKLRIYETSKEEPSRTIEQLLTTQNQLQEKLRFYETSKEETSGANAQTSNGDGRHGCKRKRC